MSISVDRLAARAPDVIALLRALAEVKLWRDKYPDATIDLFDCRLNRALSPAHVRAARAILSEVER